MLSPGAVARAAAPRRERVANKRASLGLIYVALRGGLSDMDLPGSRGASVRQSLRELFLYSDSTFDRRDLRGTLRNYLRPPTPTAVAHGKKDAGAGIRAASPPPDPGPCPEPHRDPAKARGRVA
jgi:hypothetical protein